LFTVVWAQPEGFPNAESTGLTVSKDELTPFVHQYDGYSILKTEGQIIENQKIDGILYVCANDITIRNCWIAVGALTKPSVIQVKGSDYPQGVGTYPTGILIEHCEIGDEAVPSGNRGISGPNVTVRYNNIHHGEDGGVLGSNCVWEYNYIHDLTGYVGNPDPHSDGLQAQDGISHIIIRNNTIMNNLNAAIILKSDFGPIDDVLIQNNYLDGGNYMVYSRAGLDYPAPTNVRLIDNTFGRDYNFGLISADGTIINQGNIWVDTGELIPGSSPSTTGIFTRHLLPAGGAIGAFILTDVRGRHYKAQNAMPGLRRNALPAGIYFLTTQSKGMGTHARRIVME
jgi:hypothetical protein